MNHQHRVAGQLGVAPAQVFRHVVAVARVVGHDEEDRLFPQFGVLFVGFAPLDDPQIDVIGVFLGVLGALLLGQLGAAGRIGQNWMLHHVLRDRLHQRIVGDRLHENRAVIVPRRCRHVHLE